MTDELRALIGGYATGTLTEAERKTLFEAALRDQELFDELAREQALKEAIEEPGAKQRLIAALRPARSRQWWRATWVWAAATAAVVVVIAGVVLERSTVKVEEVARLELPQPALPQPAPEPTPAPNPAPAQQVTAPQQQVARQRQGQQSAVQDRLAEPARKEAASNEPLNEPAVAKDSAASAPKPVTAPQAAPAAVREAVTVTSEASLLKTETAPVTPSVDSLPPVPPAAQSFAANRLQAGANAADALTGAPAPAGVVGGIAGGGGGGRGGGRGARGGAPAAARTLAQLAAPRLAFDYSVTPQGAVRVIPTVNGFLSARANAPASSQMLIDNRAVQAGSTTEVSPPANAASVTVFFSQQRLPAEAVSQPAGALDAVSGNKTAANPAPASILTATIPVNR